MIVRGRNPAFRSVFSVSIGKFYLCWYWRKRTDRESA